MFIRHTEPSLILIMCWKLRRKPPRRWRLTLTAMAIKGEAGGIPFPIPKSGDEVMWNHVIRYRGVAIQQKTMTENRGFQRWCLCHIGSDQNLERNCHGITRIKTRPPPSKAFIGSSSGALTARSARPAKAAWMETHHSRGHHWSDELAVSARSAACQTGAGSRI